MTLQLIPILCSLSSMIIYSSIFVLYAYFENKRRSRSRQRIIQQSIGSYDVSKIPDSFIPIKYCQEERFHRFLKIFPWEGCGWLINKKNEIVILYEKDSLIIEKQYTKEEIKIEWFGKSIVKNGLLSWIIIKIDDQTYYVTSETGSLIFGSKDTTRSIYTSITNEK